MYPLRYFCLRRIFLSQHVDNAFGLREYLITAAGSDKHHRHSTFKLHRKSSKQLNVCVEIMYDL